MSTVAKKTYTPPFTKEQIEGNNPEKKYQYLIYPLTTGYKWKRYLSNGSTKLRFVDCVYDESSTAYPNNGVKNGYYYERVETIDNLIPDKKNAIDDGKVGYTMRNSAVKIPTETRYREEIHTTTEYDYKLFEQTIELDIPESIVGCYCIYRRPISETQILLWYSLNVGSVSNINYKYLVKVILDVSSGKYTYQLYTRTMSQVGYNVQFLDDDSFISYRTASYYDEKNLSSTYGRISGNGIIENSLSSFIISNGGNGGNTYFLAGKAGSYIFGIFQHLSDGGMSDTIQILSLPSNPSANASWQKRIELTYHEFKYYQTMSNGVVVVCQDGSYNPSYFAYFMRYDQPAYPTSKEIARYIYNGSSSSGLRLLNVIPYCYDSNNNFAFFAEDGSYQSYPPRCVIQKVSSVGDLVGEPVVYDTENKNSLVAAAGTRYFPHVPIGVKTNQFPSTVIATYYNTNQITAFQIHDTSIEPIDMSISYNNLLTSDFCRYGLGIYNMKGYNFKLHGVTRVDYSDKSFTIHTIARTPITKQEIVQVPYTVTMGTSEEIYYKTPPSTSDDIYTESKPSQICYLKVDNVFNQTNLIHRGH